SYIKPHKNLFIKDMILSLLVAVVDLAFPLVTRFTMQSLLPEQKYTAFFTVMAILLAAYIMRAFSQYLVTVIGHRMGTLVEADMRRDVFSHMQSLSYSFFDHNRTGVLLARVTNDLFEIVELAHHGPENLLTCSLTIVGALIILLFINPVLSAVLLVLVPVLIFLGVKLRRGMQKASKEVRKRTGEINAAIESGISGIRTSKAFANEKTEDEKFREANEAFKESRVKLYKAMGRFMGVTDGAVGVMQVAVITAGGFLIMRGEMNYIDLITFTLYVSTFTTPIRKLIQFMEIYTQGMTGFERFLEIMRTEPEIKDSPDAVELKDVKGSIAFDDVSFSYTDGTPVLEHINVNIAPGETYALVGSSGSGKTTMCHLVPRFYDVTEGAVLVDGFNVKDLTQESLRKNIGIIQQDVFLFAGTIMENIRYGRPEASDTDVMIAAKKARIHDEIIKMPDGYDTNVGERGVVLSGGQKQRISIARVFLKDPAILILDEATSALDSVTEQMIQESLEQLSKGKTCIVIAHRLSTVRNVDRIAVVEDRQIKEEGTRDELIALNGIYAGLERAQRLS
ncbi:MAG: ABC transporter ATP-binding protein, partial [Lachnospiraceae bacterium]|nr:ABC transporter ATP-binding protein [Lachnospiraceae bacterium]